MLKERILSTLHFFDLQDYPLTLLELHKYLIRDPGQLKGELDEQGEIKVNNNHREIEKPVSISQILACLDCECRGEAESYNGFYFLARRRALVQLRLRNYFYGINREKLIKRFLKGLKYLPFVRGVGLAGSQALGEQKENSDIDLLIITHPQFMWLGRTLVTAYFQVLGKRRHGQKIKNRFCLNHYLAGPKKISQLKNLYTAAEYLKLRPQVFAHAVWAFKQTNREWLEFLFPNINVSEPEKELPPRFQEFLEKLFLGNFGLWLESKLKNWQLPKIRQEKFIVVEEDELSFHPESKQQSLLAAFLAK